MARVSMTDRSSTLPPTSGSSSAESKPRPGVQTEPKLSFSATGFRNRLHAWYSEHARDLPWRGVHDPYATWLSEIMLQQTRVATVQDRYFDFLERFPTLRALAEADEDQVLAAWSGLGYYRRARLLYRGAQFVVREWNGKLPRTAAELRTLPGVGDYTAAAVASIAFGESVAVVDGNVERVLLRILGLSEARTAAARAELASVAQALMPPPSRRPPRSGYGKPNPPGDHNQAMMELGATVCLPRAPLCPRCPVVDLCKTRGEHPTLRREPQQSRVAAHLLTLRKRGVATEVLLERRPQSASLMPGMLELPVLQIESVGDREPVLRLRHAITNTNYYVQIFAESAPGIERSLDDDHDHDSDEFVATPSQDIQPPSRNQTDWQRSNFEHLDWNEPDELDLDDEAVFVANPEELAAVRAAQNSLLDIVTSSTRNLEWVSTTTLVHCALTGLARKSLQRLGVMPLPKLRIG
jgi:A/G-specific adenine glycosylase